MNKNLLLTSIGFAAVFTASSFAANGVGASDRSGRIAQEPSNASRRVIVNGQRISDAVIEQLQRKYRTLVPDGNFWYDRVCGAWGLVGGPVAGFMHPGENLGGPLHPDASHGRTGVFINGRQLHQLDVLALLRIYPNLQRGRGWLDGSGNWGFEGGPAIDNIWAAAARAGMFQNGDVGGGGQRQGILSGYDKTGIAVY